MGRKRTPHLPPATRGAEEEVVGVGGHRAEVQAADLQELLLCGGRRVSQRTPALEQQPAAGRDPEAHLDEAVQGFMGVPSELADIRQGDLQAGVQRAGGTCALELGLAQVLGLYAECGEKVGAVDPGCPRGARVPTGSHAPTSALVAEEGREGGSKN